MTVSGCTEYYVLVPGLPWSQWGKRASTAGAVPSPLLCMPSTWPRCSAQRFLAYGVKVGTRPHSVEANGGTAVYCHCSQGTNQAHVSALEPRVRLHRYGMMIWLDSWGEAEQDPQTEQHTTAARRPRRADAQDVLDVVMLLLLNILPWLSLHPILSLPGIILGCWLLDPSCKAWGRFVDPPGIKSSQLPHCQRLSSSASLGLARGLQYSPKTHSRTADLQGLEPSIGCLVGSWPCSLAPMAGCRAARYVCEAAYVLYAVPVPDIVACLPANENVKLAKRRKVRPRVCLHIRK